MNEQNPLEELQRAMDERQEEADALKEMLSQRAQGITERKRRGRTWDETKREILGRLP